MTHNFVISPKALWDATELPKAEETIRRARGLVITPVQLSFTGVVDDRDSSAASGTLIHDRDL